MDAQESLIDEIAILVYQNCMTRKKINLADATEEWMQSRYKRPTGLFGYDGHVSYVLGGNLDHPQRGKRLQNDRWATLLSDALDLSSSIDQLWVEPRHRKITMFTHSGFDAKGLNRLMNSEIHHEGLVFTFKSLGVDAQMQGDTYMGDYTERAEARFEIIFTAQ